MTENEMKLAASGDAARPARQTRGALRKKLRIAVDFDGVLFDHVPHLLRALRDAHNVDLLEEGLRHWDFMQYRCVKRAGLTFQDIKPLLEAIETNLPLHRAGLRDPAARRVIAAWKRAGHTVNIVTAREEVAREATAQFLSLNRVPYDRLIMDAKVKTGWDLLVDDAPHNVLAASAAGGQAFLMDHPYNQAVVCDGNPRRVHTWREVGAVFPLLARAPARTLAPAHAHAEAPEAVTG